MQSVILKNQKPKTVFISIIVIIINYRMQYDRYAIFTIYIGFYL